jgi:hypothetical protein
MPLRPLLLATLLVLALAPAAHAGSPFLVGSGDRPDVAVDSAGTAHVVWNEHSGSSAVPDPLHYCQIPPRGSGCTHAQTLTAPLSTTGRDSYVFTPSPGRVIVESFRCCGTGEGNYAFESTDGGITFAPGHLIGHIDHEEAAIFGPGEAISGATIATFQRMPLAGPAPAETTRAEFDAGFPVPTHSGLGLFGGSTLVQVMSDGSHTSFVRSTSGDPNSSASWSSAQPLSPPGDEPLVASGPKGVVLLYTIGTPGNTRIVARKFDGTNFGAPVQVSEKGDPVFAGASADPASGRFHVAWIANGVIPNELRWSYSDDGVNWSAPQTIFKGDEADNAFHLRVAAGPTNKGLVVWDQNSPGGQARAATLDPGENGDATTPSDTATVDDGEVSLLVPGGCVNPGVPITLRVTHKTKIKLSPKKRVKIVYVIFSVDKKKKTDKKAAFKATFKTKGFKAPSKHKLRARVRLKPVKGKGKAKTKVLKGTLKICG